MRTVRHMVFALLLFALPVWTLAGQAETDVLHLNSGPVSGKTQGSVRMFLGIPYAAPPVASLRWKPPQEVASWTEVKRSTQFGPSCPQPDQRSDGRYSEDCLYLNVWTPAKGPGEKLPVMVWIHGGGFNFGSSSQAEYDSRNLAGKGVVVVTLNYRLGPLGFLVHPQLSRESPEGTSGNYSILDQIAALKWVQRNIAAFGGNPDRVTVFGQSAGSRSVSLLMISPLSAGLFHGAIAQSGGPIIGSEYLNPVFNGNMANASEMGQKLASKLGCDGAADVLAAMRSRSPEEVIKAADCKTGLFDEGLFFAPVFDGTVLPGNPFEAYSRGAQHDVPIITGSTLNEGNVYLKDEKDLSLERYRSFLRSRFGENADKAFGVFPASSDKDVPAAIDRVIAVAANAEPARFVVGSMERKHSRGYLYQFTRLPGTERARKLGVYHGVDLAYVFGNMKASDGYDDTDMRLSAAMMDYWVNFARTGDPNGQGLPHWPAYESTSDVNMEFSDTLRTGRHLFKKECDFINSQSIYRSR